MGIKRMMGGVLAAAALAGAGVAPATAEAASCSVGDGGITYNQSGQAAKFTSLRTLMGMNCASGRYVLNKWLRREFARGYGRRLPTSFYDGYVTWYCGKISRRRWQCDEFDSGTRFRFTAYLL